MTPEQWLNEIISNTGKMNFEKGRLDVLEQLNQLAPEQAKRFRASVAMCEEMLAKDWADWKAKHLPPLPLKPRD